MNEVIQIEGISKFYKRTQKIDGKNVQEGFWALKDISLSVHEGEIVGIIGKNGSGKSTLLKILSKITSPTRGSIKIHGRVGSLLEVGTGFHPEMTGRENIFLNGNILGLSNLEIREKFDEIIDFSGVGDFLDVPIKRYSSGMQTRLAFAVAAHLDPEILIIDEVLSVGDAGFHKKCLNKMETIGSSGRTILFVSHAMESIRNLCTRCVWIDQGKIKVDDPSCEKVIGKYLEKTIPKSFGYCWDSTKDGPSQVKDSCIEPLAFYLTDENGMKVERPVLANEQLQVSIKFWCKTAVKNLSVGYYLFKAPSQLLYLSFSTDSNVLESHDYAVGEYCLTQMFPTNLLGEGEYHFKLAVGITEIRPYYDLDNSDVQISMQVTGNSQRTNLWRQHYIQPIYPIIEWQREKCPIKNE